MKAPKGKKGKQGKQGKRPTGARRAPAEKRQAPAGEQRPSEQQQRPVFDPLMLEQSVIAIPLLKRLAEGADKFYDVIIDVNLDYPRGQDKGRRLIKEMVAKVAGEHEGVDDDDEDETSQYVFAKLNGRNIQRLVEEDEKQARERRKSKLRSVSGVEDSAFRPFLAIYRIWEDIPIGPLLTKSVSTIKADAALTSFAAGGKGIVWAVVDSGIQGDHPHFATKRTLAFPNGSMHRDFTALKGEPKQPLVDELGHGTHVAGIIAGELAVGETVTIGDPTDEDAPKTKRTIKELNAVVRRRGSNENDRRIERVAIDRIRGVAPDCKLVSLKVLSPGRRGRISHIIRALGFVQARNGFGRRHVIHGVNISVGYTFDPEWFACGQSPLCVEINRLVRMGVVVVVAAGNTGHRRGKPNGADELEIFGGGVSHSINDPGNAEEAITVGSTHREMPHTYGVSFFSSKGPTGDGRLKPDLLAPGERIVSCAQGTIKGDLVADPTRIEFDYVEQSGTSMAAPHVSGAIAAFLSIRPEFKGRPEEVKRIFLSTATDLKRDRYAQGHGMIDLMRAIQSV